MPEQEGKIVKDVEQHFIRLMPAQLIHGIPVDASHVQGLADSISLQGLVTPVTLWLPQGQDPAKIETFEIIDGFHRVEAFKRHWPGTLIRCVVDEMTQTEFENARIVSAIQHEGVKFARVARWAREIFSATPWANKEVNAADAFSDAEFNREYPNRKKNPLRKNLTPAEIQDLYAWVEEKSRFWGLTPGQIGSMLYLADLTTPDIVAKVQDTKQRPDEGGIITRRTLGNVARNVPDHDQQREMIAKIEGEKLREDEVAELVDEWKTADATQRKSLMSVPFREFVRDQREREAQRRGLLPKRSEGELRRDYDRLRITTALDSLIELTKNLRTLKLDEHPDLEDSFMREVAKLFKGIAEMNGNGVSVSDVLQRQIEILTIENANLRSDRRALLTQIEQLQSFIKRGADINRRDLTLNDD